MKVALDLELERSREEVWEKFDSFENLKQWQPGLVSADPVSGEPGQVGAVTKLTYEENGREVVLMETITARERPSEFSGIYEGKSVVNHIHNRFAEIGEDRTLWTMESDFEFSGIYRLLMIFMGGSVRKQTEKTMMSFKNFLEGAAARTDRSPRGA